MCVYVYIYSYFSIVRMRDNVSPRAYKSRCIDDIAIVVLLGCKKGGYDYEFESPPSKSLEYPVCLMTLRDPHVISCCGNEFCQVCIERVQKRAWGRG